MKDNGIGFPKVRRPMSFYLNWFSYGMAILAIGIALYAVFFGF